MAFLLYQRANGILTPTGQPFKLAGYNLIYNAWVKLDRPVNIGWHISAEELIRLHTNNAAGSATRALLIDFDPYARWRIGVIELLDIYVYTFGEGQTEPTWSPLMLRMRDIFYEEYDDEIDDAKKAAILGSLQEPQNPNEFVEFLYLTGPWGWGKNGMTNAAFLHGPARAYFRQFF